MRVDGRRKRPVSCPGVSWERWAERAVQNGGFWLVHFNYVAFWVLLALALLLLGLRLVEQRVALRRAGLTSGAPSWAAWGGAAALALASLPTAYMAVRPDETFYTTVANGAFESGDCREAAEYYGLLVEWGSADLLAHSRLAACQLRLGRLEAGLRTLAAARRLPGGDAPGLRGLAARALEVLGRPREAAVELEAVLAALPPGPERDRVALELERLRRAAEASSR